MRRVAVVGYLSIDGIAGPAGLSWQVPGGGALYAALGAALVGVGTSLLASVGRDWREPWLDRIAAIGVDVTATVRRDLPSRRETIRTLPDGRRALSDLTDRAWADATAAHAPEWPGRLRGAQLVTACPMPADRLRRLIADARAAGASVVASSSTAFAKAERGALLDLVPSLTVFAATTEQTRLLLPGQTDTDAALALARLGPAVVQTAPDGSALVVQPGGGLSMRLEGATVAPREPTGSSQARTGALAAALSRGLDLVEAAAVAMIVGAQAASAPGPQALGLALPRGGRA